MQLPREPGALVITTPVHGGLAHPVAATRQIPMNSVFIDGLTGVVQEDRINVRCRP